MSDQLVNSILQIVCEETDLRAGQLTIDTPLEQLGIDSLDVLKLAARIEQAFQVRITSDELVEIKTLSDIADRLRPKING